MNPRDLDRYLRPALRSLKLLRTGRVKALDTSGDVDVVTLDSGHRMETLVPVAVDDVVKWIPGREPLCIGKPYSTP